MVYFDCGKEFDVDIAVMQSFGIVASSYKFNNGSQSNIGLVNGNLATSNRIMVWSKPMVWSQQRVHLVASCGDCVPVAWPLA